MNSISLLTAADLSRAFDIEQRSHAFPWSAQTLQANQGERFMNFRLDCDGEMAAFAITQVVLDEATLFNLAVDPVYQRRGFGRQLLSHLVCELEKHNVMTLWLEVRASNLAALALYRQQGFNEVSLRRHYYPSANGREDAVVMALTL
ncbi:ribosomal-protein-alanine N-acetyltransferase [Erwinia sp. OLTSP20]|uniref:ribosomal protein S18-alanine N-acetyltransferase n=1 Tax=unclassified Erwinia TaxID=2622719 RepID=UPI000C5267AD|nr:MULTISPECIES: ribosomal protein S18-alanine N-acetyltransferase [unclassified Erwinia]PIJ50253.1 ribosomal-protein-alanine N-acetyltransferase [Erwinia sp. OAMSP11]PIJ72091.1 ribosomal-protein-alanine N-acetyltransferase [Erwinia sp. OLSSP12]PIJ81382.1 ribosomal-protein-alanine N-acetyltransferase [Erwinia sp. OLCASP19]PIJ84088.1 ribosomal-protein-alanine N-acetyltransferase [Erwinia sp. OLMTSP26]PIJ85787.1 ribosomal-protein-alanine N-acetyltransferase [Erwinia sp. OLMDSP33]